MDEEVELLDRLWGKVVEEVANRVLGHRGLQRRTCTGDISDEDIATALATKVG